MSIDIETNIAKLRQRIANCAAAAARDPSQIQLLAVSKTRGSEEIRRAYAAGIDQFGENYLQEALAKQPELADLPLRWHFIGPLQSNKTRAVAEHFDWVHSVERLKIAERLSRQRPADSIPLNICLQVNISGESSKAGCPPDQVLALADAVAPLPQLQLRGLMAITSGNDQQARRVGEMTAMHQLWQQLQQQHPGIDTLSLGMSADMDAAIAAGSTLLRIGRDIFGPRR